MWHFCLFTEVQFQGYLFPLGLIFNYQTVKHAAKKYLLNQIYSSGCFITDLLSTTSTVKNSWKIYQTISSLTNEKHLFTTLRNH